MAKAIGQSEKPPSTRRRKAPSGDAPKAAPAPRRAGPRHLVVVESPAKAKTINRYLGPGYVVKASMGHVRDLPARQMGVDVEHDFAPAYEPLAGRKKVLAELQKYADAAPQVFLATDLDREGEAIAWHLAEALKIAPEKIQRVIFNEITAGAIREAFAHPRAIDMNKVNAQQARRILDRLVGYEISPLLWRKVARGLSAGRVQSVAVRLIVERERLIEAFVPEEYWRMGAVFTPQRDQAPRLAAEWADFVQRRDERGNGPTAAQEQEFLAAAGAFRAELAQWNGKKFEVSDEAAALEIAQALGTVIVEVQRTADPQGKGPAATRLEIRSSVGAERPRFVVRGLAQRDTTTRPYAPFTTVTLQQAASVQLRFGASRTMRVAQQLYEGVDVPGAGSVGLITYMRTDSTRLSQEAVAGARSLIAESFGASYVPEKPNVYASGERAQEAHEAVRPSDVKRTPQSLLGALSDEQYKLYELIWKRFVACQMPPARWKVTEADILAATPAGEGLLKAMGRQLVFDGFLRVAGLPRSTEPILPALASGQEVAPIELLPTQHFTQAPPRYTEASLVKALEADGIGRPSTYAAIIQTIQDRSYVELMERSFRPTHLGVVVTDKLVKHFPDVFDVRFTAHMEDDLDRVEDASIDWVGVLREFYGPFQQALARAKEEMVHAKAESTPSEYACETCGKPMVYRFNKTGRYLACTGYPECKTTCPVDEEGKKAVRKEVDVACPRCGKPMIVRRSRFGPFLSCSTYPDCDGSLNLDRKGLLKTPSAPPLKVDMPCPKCGSPFYLRRGKRGPWLSCSKYPKCRARLAWNSLEEPRRAALENDLAAHEAQHPPVVLRRRDGTPLEANFNPISGTVEAGPATAAPQPADVACPKCGQPMLIREGKRGRFLACSGYPRCRNALPLEQLEELKAQQAGKTKT